jgi:hypothetical protein
VLGPDVLLDFAVQYVLPNEIGSLVALVGERGCCIVKLPRRVRAEMNKRPNAVVHAKVTAPGHLFFGTHADVNVIKARWHPASLNHLALLCSDNALRLYNAYAADAEDPEQLLRVAVESLSVLSFDFGCSLDWTHFTVFYALSDGNIYAQCPVLPQGCPIPEELIAALEARQKGEVERLDAKLAKLQKAPAQPDQQKRIRRAVKRAAAAARALKWAESLRGGKQMALNELPLVQGPLTVPLAEVDELPVEERVCDLAVAGTLFPVLVSAFESGLVEMRLQLSSVLPAWPEKGVAAGGARLEALVLFDRLDVAPSVIKGMGGAELPKEHPLPLLHSDPLHANLWYLSHAGGIDCLALTDLDSVLRGLEASVKSGTGKGAAPSLPRADTACLLQRDMCSAGMRMRSLAVVATAGGEYFLAYDCEDAASMSSIDLLGSVSANATTSHVLALEGESQAEEALHREAAWVGELRELDKRRPKAIPHVESISAGKLTRLQQISMATQLAEQYKRHAAHLAEGVSVLNAAGDDVAAREEEVKRTTRLALERLGLFAKRAEGFDAYLERVKRNDKNLRERVAVLSGVLTDLQPTLSDAERAYFGLLKSKEGELTSMEANIDGLHRFVDTHPAIFERKESLVADAELLDDQRLMILQENLEQQNEAIAKLVATVKQLQHKTTSY